MTQRNVETLLGRLLTDALLRQRFVDNAALVLEEFRTEGHELTATELDALAATDRSVLRTLAEALDRRIRKIDVHQDADLDPSPR